MSLQSLFKLGEHGTDVRTEVMAGVTTFLTMSYIIFVNPSILSTTGMDHNAVFIATCLAAALGTFIMAFVANWPVGLAPGMGLNAFFAFTVVKGMGFTWQQALGAVFISGCVFVALTITGVRRWLVGGIPTSLRSAIAAGIGMFLAIIALSGAGIVVANPATKVGLGNLHSLPVLLATLGFLLIAVLDYFRLRGAILIGILAVTAASMLLGLTHFQGIVSAPPSISPTLLKLDIPGALRGGFFHIILVFARKARLLDGGREEGLGRALFADSLAIFSGSLLGTSSTTAYIESASGVQAGGRTGLTALTVGVLFLAALFFAPLAAVVPPWATAPALLYVAGLMMRELLQIDWNDVTEAVPSALAALVMPFTYSIANGLAFGFIAYAALKLFTGRAREVHPALWVVAALFVLRFALFPAD